MLRLIKYYFKLITSMDYRFKDTALVFWEGDYCGVKQPFQADSNTGLNRIRINYNLAKAIRHKKEQIVLLIAHELGHIYYKHRGGNLLFADREELIAQERQADCYAGFILKKLNMCPIEAFKLFSETLELKPSVRYPYHPDYETRYHDVCRGSLYTRDFDISSYEVTMENFNGLI
jgi:hypothetical protein